MLTNGWRPKALVAGFLLTDAAMNTTARRFLALFSLFLAFAAAGLPRPAAAQIPYINQLFNEPRYAAIVVDANTGEVLYSKHADSPRYPASITKIMTLYLTFEALQAGRLSLSDQLVVSPHAASMAPSKLGLRSGQTITVDEAMRAVAVKSANDMAVALAERIGGSESRFAALMTLRAQELGMVNTHYVNASGLPDARQLSSARDIAILSRAVMRDYPQYYGYFGQHQFSYHGEVINNHNHLLDSMPGVDGLKTGYTNASGFNLAASAVRNGRRLITVVLGGSSTAARDNNVQDLLNTGFDVMKRRDRGETITIAQSLFEPDASGPILRPVTEQGDADQRGLRIVLGDSGQASAMQPIPDPIVRPLLAAASAPASRVECSTVKVEKTVRGRHGRRRHVTVRERSCHREGVTAARLSTVAPSEKTCRTVRHGRRHRLVCEARDTRVADASPARGGKAGGSWQIKVGAFKSRADAKAQLRSARRASDDLADARPAVGGARGHFHASFTGLSASEARHACADLRAHGHSCQAENVG